MGKSDNNNIIFMVDNVTPSNFELNQENFEFWVKCDH